MKEFNFPAWDTDLFITLNGLHADWLDPIMIALSSAKFWIPMYIAIAYFMAKRSGRVKGIVAILSMITGFAMADSLSVALFKNTFKRLRPCYTDQLQNIIYSIEGCGGTYGFVSSHAANTFCLAMFTAAFFKNKYYSAFIFMWASAVSYSRIYVGKHYPLDVICGAIFGMLCGLVAYLIYNACMKFIENRNLFSKFTKQA